MTKHEALTIVASLCADGVLDEKEEAILRKALAQPSGSIEQEPVAQAGPPVAQVQAVVMAQAQLIEDYKALLSKTLPALIRLGDFVGNVDNGGASGLGRIDRCALILEVKNAIGK